jgi:SOS-response transcriptional repressor LexA
LPHALTDLQKEYLAFIREYIRENEFSPRLEELAQHFKVKSPTAHKILQEIMKKGYLYFRRDPVSGFFIRLIERAGTNEMITEVPIAGRVGELGEVYDFPKELGHFASVLVGSLPENLFALVVMEPNPDVSIANGDLIIFDQGKKPQPGDICIGPIGNRFFLVRIAGKTLDKEVQSFETTIWYPIPENLIDPDVEQYLNWFPLAYDENSRDRFIAIAEEQNFPIAPLPPNFIVATALRLIRALTA